MPRLPKRFPENTKYVVEACGPIIRRYVELPDGRRIHLPPRKPKPCSCLEQSTSIVPDHDIAGPQPLDRRVFA